MNKIIDKNEAVKMLGPLCKESREQALQFLEADLAFYVDIAEPIRRGFANILYADAEKGVIIQETHGGTYMLGLKDKSIGRRFIEALDECQLMNVHSEELADVAISKFHFNTKEAVYQYVSLKKAYHVPNDTDLDIRVARVQDIPLIMENYKIYDEEDLLRMIKRKELFCGYVKDQLAGFIGMHEEGSLGILHVMKEYRRRGYGEILEAYDTQSVIDKGWIPYGQVDVDNAASHALQKKMGNKRSDAIIYWLFNE